MLDLQRAAGNQAFAAAIVAEPQGRVQRYLKGKGSDLYYGTQTKSDYRFDIEPAIDQTIDVEGEPIRIAFEERPIFIKQPSGRHIGITTLGLLEKENIRQLYARLGVYFEPAEAAATIRPPGPVGLTSRARKGLVLTGYLDVIKEKKRLLKSSGRWTDKLEKDFNHLRVHISKENWVTGWQVLKRLASGLNAVTDVSGLGPVRMTQDEKVAILHAIIPAKEKAVSLLAALAKDRDLLRAEFRVNLEDQVDAIAKNIALIANHLSSMDLNRFPLDEDGSLAFARVGALNSGVGIAATIKLSRRFLDHSLDRRAAELIHEASHGTQGVQTKDLAYLDAWADAIVKGASAMVNAPTYERAAIAKAAQLGGSEHARVKRLAYSGNDDPTRDRFVNILGRLDFKITQAWWFAANVNNFAAKVPEDKVLADTREELGFNAELFGERHFWVKQFCALFGTPVSKVQTDRQGVRRTMFTPADHELIGLCVRSLSALKDAVNSVSSLKIDDSDDSGLGGGELRIRTSDLAKEDEEFEKWIVRETGAALKTPATIKGPDENSFYDRIRTLSAWKDSVEPGIDKTGLT